MRKILRSSRQKLSGFLKRVFGSRTSGKPEQPQYQKPDRRFYPERDAALAFVENAVKEGRVRREMAEGILGAARQAASESDSQVLSMLDLTPSEREVAQQLYYRIERKSTLALPDELAEAIKVQFARSNLVPEQKAKCQMAAEWLVEKIKTSESLGEIEMHKKYAYTNFTVEEIRLAEDLRGIFSKHRPK